MHERLTDGASPSVRRKMPAEVDEKRAWPCQAPIALYDEPTTGLDPIMTDVINELIVSRDRPHHSIVVTHDMVTVGGRWTKITALA